MKATILNDIDKKETKFDAKKEIYINGFDNAYPERMDRLINNSVTANTATNLMIQSLLQRGFGNHDNVIVNKNKKLSLYSFADDLANSKVRQRGMFVWIGWNANYKIDSVEVLPFNHCRLGKSDSEDYTAKIHYSKKWNEGKQDDLIIFDVFNPDSAVIDTQVEKDGGWSAYKGQVLYINDDSDYIYPLSRIDAVSLDCDNENQISVYKNVSLRKGFFGKTMIVTRPLIDKDLPKLIVRDNIEVRNPEYWEAESEREAFKSTLEDFVGAENTGGVLHVELDFEHENLEDAILVKNIESNIDDKIFAHTESSVRKNILIAFNNLPNGLVEQSEGIFSNSGEAIKQMKLQFDDNCQKERKQLLFILNDIWKRMEVYDNTVINIVNNGEETSILGKSLEEKTQDAQSELRGSVGGVTSLLLIQQSVSQKTTSYESGVAMLQNIYGYSEEVARKMLGTIEINPNPTPDATI